MIKVAISIAVIIVLSILALQIDDNLDPNARDFLNRAVPAEHSNAFLYLMGISAAADEDPLDTGKQIFQSIQQGEETYIRDKQKFSFQSYPEEKKLPLPEGEMFCSGAQVQCLDNILSADFDLEFITKTHGILLNRYRTFLSLNDYRTLTRALMEEPLPAGVYLTKGNRIEVLTAIDAARDSRVEEAIGILMGNLSSLRNHLKQADTVIGKLICLMLISENIDVLSALLLTNNYNSNQPLAPISIDERNFDIPMARELAMIYENYKHMDKHPEFWRSGGNMPGWIVRAAFKPNMSINDIFPLYDLPAKHMKLEQQRFASVAMFDTAHSDSDGAVIRNFAGSVLNKSVGATYHRYAARFFDLNAKIALFNEAVKSGDLQATISTAKNPYYAESSPAYFSDDAKHLCFNGPLKTDLNLRRLRVKL